MEEIKKLGIFPFFWARLRGLFLWAFSFLVNSSLRIEIIGKAQADALEAEKKPFIFALFHHSYFSPFYIYRYKSLSTLIADNVDGETLATFAKLYGYQPIRIPVEEKSPKAARAAIQMVRALKEHPLGVIAVDGPYGPFEKVKPGIFLIAQKTGAKVIPVGVAYKKALVFKKRWDKYRLPFPFSRIKVIIGEPLAVPQILADKEMQELCERTEDMLKKLDKDASGLAG